MTEEEFYSVCDKLHKEYANSMWIESPDWPEERQASYSCGPIHGMYREHNRGLEDMLSRQADIKRIVKYLLKTKKETNRDGRKLVIEALGKEEYERRVKKGEFCYEYPELTTENIVSWVNKYNYLILNDLQGESEQRQLMFLQLYYGYKEYKNRKRETEIFCQDNIKSIYDTILAKSSDYGKYGLIPVSDRRELVVCEPPRIYDAVIDKTVFLWISRAVSEVLDGLICEGYIRKSAYRGCDDKIFEGRFDKEYLCEATERGRIFSLHIDYLPAITKLYSTVTEYEDQLWVLKDEQNITFEELCEEEDEYSNKGYITTQMIHIMYSEINGDLIITHLDHELIFYTREEFSERRRNPYKKGNAHTRIKTFKLDEAKIPFDYQCEMWDFKDGKLSDKTIRVPFIFFILNAFFEHKDLVKEYFEKVI